MKSLLKAALGIVVLIVANFVSANQDADLFLGFELGKSSSDYYDDIFKLAANNSSNDKVSVVGSAETSSGAFRLFGGVMLSQKVGVQLSYVDFGAYKYAVSASTGGIKNGEIGTSGVYSDFIFQTPIDANWGKLFCELGVGVAFMDVDDASIEDNGGSFHIGAGIKATLTKYIDVQAGAHKYFINAEDGSGKIKFGEVSFNLFSAGLTLYY